MIIIGINGNPGSGKTTASNLLLNNESKLVIHLDDIFNEIKQLLPKNNVKTFKRDSYDTMILNRNGLLYKTVNLKIVNKQFELAKKIYANKVLKRKIEQAFIDGVDYFVIEGANLENYGITYLLDYLIFINASQEDRIDRLIKRDREYSDMILKKSLNMLDGIDMKKYNLIIDNVGSKDEFSQKCLEATSMIIGDISKVKQLKI